MLCTPFKRAAAAISRHFQEGHPDFNMPETGLTKELADVLFQQAITNIAIERRPDENVTGADFDLHLIDANNCISLRLQAKRQFPRNNTMGSYTSLDLQQLNDLENNCPMDFTPLVIFYNGHPDTHLWDGMEDPEPTGCTLASLARTKTLLVNRPQNKTVVAHLTSSIPWHRIVCADQIPVLDHAKDVLFAQLNLGAQIRRTPISILNIWKKHKATMERIQARGGPTDYIPQYQLPGRISRIFLEGHRDAARVYFREHPNTQTVVVAIVGEWPD